MSDELVSDGAVKDGSVRDGAVVDSAAGALVWRRVHPVTPAVRGWKVLAVVLVIVAQQVSVNVRSAQDVVDSVGILPVLGVIGLVVLIGTGYAVLAWRMTRFAVDPEAVYLQTGVLFRQQRTARLDRVQAIDVVQPILARILGLAELKLEVAGGADSAVHLAYLKESDAQRLRNELLARAAGVSFGTEETPEAPVAPERPLYEVPPGQLIGSLLLSVPTLLVVVAAVVVAAVAIPAGGAGLLVGFIPAALGIGAYFWGRFSGEFNFRAAQSPDGIRLRHGLLESRAQTVPPGRVQAVELVQGPLWRGKDWWRVKINVAGYGVTQQDTESVLLPVGSRQEALVALWLVLPDLGTDDPRGLLDAALSGRDQDHGFTTSPRRAFWLDPWSWRRNGYALTERAFLARSGRFVRRLVVVPHERTQSLGLVQGPLQRRLGLASMALHSTPGPVAPAVRHQDALGARTLVGEQAQRARTARASAGPERWMLELEAQAEAPVVPGPEVR